MLVGPIGLIPFASSLSYTVYPATTNFALRTSLSLSPSRASPGDS